MVVVVEPDDPAEWISQDWQSGEYGMESGNTGVDGGGGGMLVTAAWKETESSGDAIQSTAYFFMTVF